MVEAEAALARFDQAARQVPEPRLIWGPGLRREARSTSALEGTWAPFEDVLEADIVHRAHLSAELREVLNFVVTAEEGFAWIAERPISGVLIRNLQKVLVKGTAGDFADASDLRDRQVFIGPREAAIDDARFVPVPPGDLPAADFDAWLQWVDAAPAETAVIQAALAHYQFEILRPFSDGNGRVGRLLIVLQLMQLDVLQHPVLVVSPWFEARRQEYQDSLLALSRSGDGNAWVSFFATGIGAAARATHDRILALLDWRETAVASVRNAGVVGVAERIAHELIGAPIIQPGTVAARHGVTRQAARNALRRRADLGIVTEGSRNGRLVFRAPAVIDILST